MDGFMHYSLGPSHCCDLLADMDRQRKTGDETVCDVRFTVGGRSVYAHRSVLAVCSAYFQGMLSGAFSESQGEGGTNSRMMDIDLSGAMSTSEDLDALLSAVYIGSLKLSRHNVMGVTELACFLLVDSVRKACETFLLEHLTIDTCLSSLHLAHRFDLPHLFRNTYRILQGRFHDHFIHQPEMLTTPASCLRQLTRIHTYVPLHDLVQFLTRWVDASDDGKGGGSGGEERACRLAAAELIVSDVYLTFWVQHKGHVHHQVCQHKLDGSADIIEALLGCVVLMKDSELPPALATDLASVCPQPLYHYQFEVSSPDSSTPAPLKRPASDTPHPTPSGRAKVRKVNAVSALTDVVVAFVPAEAAVQYFTAIDCQKNRPRFCPLDLHVCIYHVPQRQWLHAGTTRFPVRFEEKDAWRVTCVNAKAYFISVKRRLLHVLDLQTLTWSPLDCARLFTITTSPSSAHRDRVRSLLPIAAGDKLYVLASNKEFQDDGSELFITNQQYFELGQDRQWKPLASVQHCHTTNPLTFCNVSGNKVYVAKAAVSHSTLMVNEGHIFDCETGAVEMLNGTLYATSPLRLLVQDGHMHVVDGSSMHSELLIDNQEWKHWGDVDLFGIKMARMACTETHLPCAGLSSTVMGSSVWEFSNLPLCRSMLTELRLSPQGEVFTVRHTPPPFYYITISAACRLGAQFLASLKPCQYLHADVVSFSAVDLIWR